MSLADHPEAVTHGRVKLVWIEYYDKFLFNVQFDVKIYKIISSTDYFGTDSDSFPNL